MLCEHDAVVTVHENTAAKNDECGGGADEEGVGVDAECLYESLFHRVADRCGRCGVWSRAFARFIAEKPALDTHDHGCAYASAQSFVKAECVFDNHGHDGGEMGDVEGNYYDSQNNIGYRHKGNNDFAETRHSLYTAPDDDEGQDAERPCGQFAWN